MIPETLAMAETSRKTNSRINNHDQNNPIDPISLQNSCIIQPTRSKTTISSIVSSLSPPPKKNSNFSSSKFRAMGCTSSSHVSVPAVIRTSATWEPKKVKKKKHKKGKVGFSSFGGNLGGSCNDILKNDGNSLGSLAVSSRCVDVPDDCVVSRRPVSDRGKVDGERTTFRQRPSHPARRMVSPEDIPFIVPDGTLEVSRSRLDMSRSRHRHVRHGYPDDLAEIVMLQSSLLMGGRPSRLDRYRDLRLDVDNMSYEELLELGDRIGHVSTGLRDDEIARCLRKTKLSGVNLAPHITAEMEKKCSICQEEYEVEDEMGKLKCGHFYHIDCIKQWLEQKNCCPICKTSAASHG